MNNINPKEDLLAWLNQEPSEADIMIHPKTLGKYIPIEIIKPRLDILDPSWSTRNFKHLFFADHNGRLFCSGSIDLCVRYTIGVPYDKMLIERTISGAATFDTNDYEKEGNTHYGQTCLSLCIVAAAKEIGRYFGRDLNKVIPEEKENKIANTLKNLPLGNPLAKQ